MMMPPPPSKRDTEAESVVVVRIVVWVVVAGAVVVRIPRIVEAVMEAVEVAPVGVWPAVEISIAVIVLGHDGLIAVTHNLNVIGALLVLHGRELCVASRQS